VLYNTKYTGKKDHGGKKKKKTQKWEKQKQEKNRFKASEDGHPKGVTAMNCKM